jgi:3-phenylpropionate/trans-cinnamate dioxygenase ferredoxin subunit
VSDALVKVAHLSDLTPGEPLGVETLDGETVCLVLVDGEVYAFQDRCSHRDFPLSNGRLDDGQIECAWHGARFDVRTGRALCLPAIKSIRVYEVKVENDEIYIGI